MFDFVNRVKEKAKFSEMINGASKYRLMPLLIESGHGKSFLLQQFKDICQAQGLRHAFLDLDAQQGMVLGYADGAIRLARELGATHFAETLKSVAPKPAIQVQTGAGAGTVDFGEGNRLPHGQVSQLQGRDKIEISHVTINGEMYRQQQTVLGLSWKEELRQLCAGQRVVLLLDTYEKATAETHAWLHDWLFQPLAEYRQLYVVVAGQPTDRLRQYFKTDRHIWRPLMYPVQEKFEPFDEAHVQEYLDKRGLPLKSDWVLTLKTICPHLPMRSVALVCDGWEQEQERDHEPN